MSQTNQTSYISLKNISCSWIKFKTPEKDHYVVTLNPNAADALRLDEFMLAHWNENKNSEITGMPKPLPISPQYAGGKKLQENGTTTFTAKQKTTKTIDGVIAANPVKLYSRSNQLIAPADMPLLGNGTILNLNLRAYCTSFQKQKAGVSLFISNAQIVKAVQFNGTGFEDLGEEEPINGDFNFLDEVASCISEDQEKILLTLVKTLNLSTAQVGDILKVYGVSMIHELPKSKFAEVLATLS